MFGLLKGIFLLLGDLISVRKDEFKFNSRYFNPKKLLVMTLMVVSIILNVVMSDKIMRMNKQQIVLEQQLAEERSKNQPDGSSDSGNGLKPSDGWGYSAGRDSFIDF